VHSYLIVLTIAYCKKDSIQMKMHWQDILFMSMSLNNLMPKKFEYETIDFWYCFGALLKNHCTS
jgi:hypothetical protein